VLKCIVGYLQQSGAPWPTARWQILSQCTMVSDNLTGTDLWKGRPSGCSTQCQDAYRSCLAAEKKRHATQVNYCKSLPQPDQSSCLQAEQALNNANTAQCASQRDACLGGCHSQGTGSGG
jgi:hypothetical protein